MAQSRLSAAKNSKVYMYFGYGAAPMSSFMLLQALHKHVDPKKHDIEVISPEKIKLGTWTNDAALLILGGGFDLGFIEALGDNGMACIHDYVWKKGGSYLGLGAGGYFACDSIEFDKEGPQQVLGERPLKFFAGRCIGPVYPGFEYKTFRGAVAAPTNFACYDPWKEALGTVNLYTDGGGYFADTAGSHILARYQDITDAPAAMVMCEVGNKGGKAVLTGGHFEYSPELLSPGKNYLNPSVVSGIAETDHRRQLLMNFVLTYLGIQTNPVA